MSRSAAPARPWRVMGLLFVLAVLVGPVAEAFAESTAATAYGFPFLFSTVGVVLGFLGREAERLVFGIGQRTWLQGERRRRQLLALPYGTGTIFGASFALISPAIGVLLTAPPGWTALNIGAFSCFVAGGALSGFALSRLLVGLLIVHRSGHWDASGRDWTIGAAVVVLGTFASAGYLAATLLHTAPGI